MLRKRNDDVSISTRARFERRLQRRLSSRGMTMIRNLMLAASLALLSTSAFAAPCRNAKGKFIKCGIAAPGKGMRCKAANRTFAKCRTSAAKPV